MFPTDLPGELFLYHITAQFWSERFPFDPYLATSMFLFAGYNDEDEIVIDVLNTAWQKAESYHVLIGVAPSHAFVRVFQRKTRIPPNLLINPVRFFLMDNIGIWNSSKVNDIRAPLTIPVDVSIAETLENGQINY